MIDVTVVWAVVAGALVVVALAVVILAIAMTRLAGDARKLVASSDASSASSSWSCRRRCGTSGSPVIEVIGRSQERG